MYWLTGFPDYHVEVEEVLAKKEMVTARYYFTGTHQGEVLGIATTGRTIKISGIWMCRVEDGQLVECWEEYDHHSLLQQLNVKPD
jgi:predicted ester cyclase